MTKIRKPREFLVVLLFTLPLVGVGCGDSGKTKDLTQTEGAKAGTLSSGYFFEENGDRKSVV